MVYRIYCWIPAIPSYEKPNRFGVLKMYKKLSSWWYFIFMQVERHFVHVPGTAKVITSTTESKYNKRDKRLPQNALLKTLPHEALLKEFLNYFSSQQYYIWEDRKHLIALFINTRALPYRDVAVSAKWTDCIASSRIYRLPHYSSNLHNETELCAQTTRYAWEAEDRRTAWPAHNTLLYQESGR